MEVSKDSLHSLSQGTLPLQSENSLAKCIAYLYLANQPQYDFKASVYSKTARIKICAKIGTKLLCTLDVLTNDAQIYLKNCLLLTFNFRKNVLYRTKNHIRLKNKT